MIKIVVDSTADITDELRAEFDVTVIPVLVQFGDQTFQDGINITRDQFYERLLAKTEHPKTAAPAIGTYAEAFQKLVDQGHEILSISVAGGLSGTFNAAQLGAQSVEGATIACVDGTNMAFTLSYLVQLAGRAIQNGATLAEVVALLERRRQDTYILVALDTLEYLERGGRIGKAKAWIGTMLNVKPIIEIRNNQLAPQEQVRTWKRVPARLVELARARGELEELTVQYTTDVRVAEILADLCASEGLMPRERIRIIQATGVLGVHAGPGAVAITALVKS